MSQNPYAPANEPLESLETDGFWIDGAPAASQNKRFANFFVDSLLVRVVAMAGGFAVGIAYAASTGAQQITKEQEFQLNLIGFAIGLAIGMSYFVILEGIFGWTFGKLLTGTRVINATGGSPRFGQILGRSLCRFIPFEPFSFLMGDTTTGWHDSLSGTRVIDVRARHG